MGRIAGYHFGWRDERGRPVDTDGAGGKSVRPALVLLAAKAVGGTRRTGPAAACAAELVHNFSLLHDDVMDRDLTRRHRPTSWTVFGSSAAILAGDALLTLAFDVLAGAGERAEGRPGCARSHRSCTTLVDGQSADISFEERARRRPRRVRADGGGQDRLAAGRRVQPRRDLRWWRPEQVDRLREFGEHVGLAFQFVDDLLGIWGDPGVTGKAVYSDLVNRKKSLPVVATLTSGTAAGGGAGRRCTSATAS